MTVACRSLRITDGRAKFAGEVPYQPNSSWEKKMTRDRSLITDMPRDKYVERCKQRAFDYLDQGDFKNATASIVSHMNARPDCKLPDYWATLGVSLLMANDAIGLRALIEELR